MPAERPRECDAGHGGKRQSRPEGAAGLKNRPLEPMTPMTAREFPRP